MNEIKIAHLIETLDIGGAENVLVNIVNHLDLRFEPLVICLKHSGPMADRITRKGVEVIELHKDEGNDYLIPFVLARILHKKGIKILQTHNWGVFCEGISAALLARIPICIHMVHGHFTMYPPGLMFKLKKNIRHHIESLFCRATDMIIPVSNDVFKCISQTLNIPLNKIKIIKNGIEIPEKKVVSKKIMEELNITDRERIIISVGRLDKVKNYPMLLKAISMLETSIPLRLIIVGDGPERHGLERMINEMSLQDRVLLLGNRSDVREILSIGHIFVMASRYEGTSIAILEAMSMRLPIVVTSVGGNPDLIRNGENGYLTMPDDPRDLTEKLSLLLMDHNKCIIMGENAYSSVKQEFSLDIVIKSYEKIYLNLLRGKGYFCIVANQ